MADEDILDMPANDEEPEIDWVDRNPHEDIAAALNSLMAVDGMDDKMLSKAGRKRVEQIKRWSLRIIHHNLKEIYTDTDFLTDDSTEEEEE